MIPKVTVYITNYNYGKYLDRAVNSVLEQTFQDYELLIIDDGSTDGSKEIIGKYQDLKNVFVIFQSNKGLNATNNVALKMARGKYIMRLDADDYLDPHALEIMVSKMEKSADLALVFPDYYEVDHNGEIINHIRRHNFDNDVTLYDQPAHGACTMFRKKILDEVGGYDESVRKQDGYDIWLKIIEHYRISNINLPLFYYRQHQNSITQNKEDLLKVRSKIKEKHVINRGEKLSVLAVIPTRGTDIDPRSIPLIKIGKKCLIDWTIESALDSKYIDNIIISTPEKNILNHVEKKYAEKVLLRERNPALAKINLGVEATISDALSFYESEFPSPDAIMVLNIESPFRTYTYINKAIHTMQLYNLDSVIGAVNDDGIFFEHDGSGLIPKKQNSELRLERHNLFRKVGGITLVKRESFLRENKLITGKIGHILMDDKAASVIDSEFSLQLFNAINLK